MTTSKLWSLVTVLACGLGFVSILIFGLVRDGCTHTYPNAESYVQIREKIGPCQHEVDEARAWAVMEISERHSFLGEEGRLPKAAQWQPSAETIEAEMAQRLKLHTWANWPNALAKHVMDTQCQFYLIPEAPNGGD
jgi:hypothetical protein